MTDVFRSLLILTKVISRTSPTKLCYLTIFPSYLYFWHWPMVLLFGEQLYYTEIGKLRVVTGTVNTRFFDTICLRKRQFIMSLRLLCFFLESFIGDNWQSWKSEGNTGVFIYLFLSSMRSVKVLSRLSILLVLLHRDCTPNYCPYFNFRVFI